MTVPSFCSSQSKLEDALKQAQDFHDSLQSFISWLTNAEKTLNNLKPASMVMETLSQQIDDHKVGSNTIIVLGKICFVFTVMTTG